MQKLTQRACDTTEQGPGQGKLLIRDSELKGFGLSVSGRSKSYFVECRVKGQKRRVTIGRADLISLKDARTQARKLLADMLAGFDPTAQKRNEKTSSVTLIELVEEYVQAKVLKPSTVSVYRRQMKNAFRMWLHLPIVAITKNMVADRHREMSNGTSRGTSGKAYANGCFKTLQAMLNYASEKYEIDGQSLIPVNPVSRLTKTRAWYRVRPRTGVIPEYKLARGKAVDEISYKDRQKLPSVHAIHWHSQERRNRFEVDRH